MTDHSSGISYHAAHKSNSVLKGTGRVCVVTGWLSKELIALRVSNSEYAAIGNLYSSSRGINFLVRNLLLNPHVGFIVILESTKQDLNSGSSRCLFDFFLNGVTEFADRNGKRTWKINSDIEGFIDIEIEIESLEYIRNSITPVIVKSVDGAVNAISEFCLQAKLREEAGKGSDLGDSFVNIKREFLIHSPTSNVKPNQLCGHLISADNIANAWVKILHRIRTSGTIRRHVHDGEWQELIDVMTIVRNEPPNLYFPEPNYLPVDRKFISDYIPSVLYDSPYVEGIKYTYGQRMRSWFNRDQIAGVITKISADIDTTRAVISLWDTSDHDEGNNPPCLNHIWFRVNKINDAYMLSLTATFRSNDMFGAWVSNAMALRALQCHVGENVAQLIGADIFCAELITISQSAHIYDDSWENVDYLLSQQSRAINRADYYDPIGNFIIEVECGDVVVTHTNPDNGCTVGTYSGKNPLKLLREICADMPSISPSHAGYLGIEIHRASDCLKTNNQYIQDC